MNTRTVVAEAHATLFIDIKENAYRVLAPAAEDRAGNRPEDQPVSHEGLQTT